jgi:hypothetical protein
MQYPRPFKEEEDRTHQTLPVTHATRATHPVNYTRTCNKLPDVYM